MSIMPPPAAAAQTQPPPKRSRWPALLASLALLGVLGASAIGYEYARQLRLHLQSLDQRLSQLRQEQTQTLEQFSVSRERIANETGHMQGLLTAIKEQQDAVQRHSQQVEQTQQVATIQYDAVQSRLAELHQRIGGDERQWLIAEAGHLITMAKVRTQLEGRPDSAILLLETAQGRIRATNDPHWEALTHAIEEDLAALRAVPQVNFAAMDRALEQLARQVPALLVAQESPHESTPTTAPEPWMIWRERIEALFNRLLVIRRHANPVSTARAPLPYMTPKERLAVDLEAMRLALLRRQATAYQVAWESAQQTLDQSFPATVQINQTFREQWAPFRVLNPEPVLPELRSPGAFATLRGGFR